MSQRDLLPTTSGSLLSWRNRLTHAVCNWMLNHVATLEYRAWVDVSIRRGLKSILAEQETPNV